MRTYLMIAAVGCLAGALATSCGSNVIVPADSSGGVGSSTGSSSTGAGGSPVSSSTSGDVGGGFGLGGFGGTSGGGTGGSPDMPGLFDCGGCLCDGATHYCKFDSGGGPAPAPGPPPQPLCADDAGVTSCKPIPAECLSSPTCYCLGQPESICSCTVAHEGVVVSCVYP